MIHKIVLTESFFDKYSKFWTTEATVEIVNVKIPVSNLGVFERTLVTVQDVKVCC